MFLYIFIKKIYKIYKFYKIKNIPQNSESRFSKTASPTFGPFMRTFGEHSKPLHNGLHVTTQVNKSKSIM